ncbi:MAG: hypothetical protein V3R77_10005, partial [Candidatus Binatia bacterium]
MQPILDIFRHVIAVPALPHEDPTEFEAKRLLTGLLAFGLIGRVALTTMEGIAAGSSAVATSLCYMAYLAVCYAWLRATGRN